MAGELKYCTQDPRCQGPKLVEGHKCAAGENCDNDHCWVPCPYCSSDEEADAATLN